MPLAGASCYLSPRNNAGQSQPIMLSVSVSDRLSVLAVNVLMDFSDRAVAINDGSVVGGF